MTRSRLSPASVALAAILLAAAPGARAADPAADLQTPENLFISPSGQPFTAPVADPYPIVLWFRQADKNGDGKIDADEFRADAAAFFDKLDLNHDGVISTEEIQVYEHAVAPQILSQQGSQAEYTSTDDDQKLNRDEGAAYYGLFQEPEPITAADRNFDFKVTLKEFLDQADRHFQALDAKGRGYLTLADLPRTQAEKAAKAKRTADDKTAKAPPRG